jgi:hypothetical protein
MANHDGKLKEAGRLLLHDLELIVVAGVGMGKGSPGAWWSVDSTPQYPGQRKSWILGSNLRRQIAARKAGLGAQPNRAKK